MQKNPLTNMKLVASLVIYFFLIVAIFYNTSVSIVDRFSNNLAAVNKTSATTLANCISAREGLSADLSSVKKDSKLSAQKTLEYREKLKNCSVLSTVVPKQGGGIAGGTPSCPADITGDGFVNQTDLNAVLGAWGTSGGPADIDKNGTVNIDDLMAVVSGWGVCPGNGGGGGGAPVLPVSGLVGSYHLDGNTNDSSSGGNNGGNNGANCSVTGKYGMACSFSQASIDLSSLFDNFTPAAGTLALWMNRSFDDTTPKNPTSIALGKDSNNLVEFYYDTGINQFVVNYIAGGKLNTIHFAGGTIPKNTWTHVAISWDKTADQVKLYVNGSQVGGTQSGLGNWTSLPIKGFIGNSTTATGSNDYYEGMIDEVGVWTRALSAGEISGISGGTTPPPPPPGTCGDGAINSGEQCDGSNLGGFSCTTVPGGFTGGSLSCNQNCTFNTGSCTNPPPAAVCGNGIIEVGEQCDGSNLGGMTCQTQGFPLGGTLSCTTNTCQFNTNQCNSSNQGGAFNMTSSRLAGVAPLSINFNGIEGKTWSQYSDQDFQWDFGDGSPSFNGFLAAHVFNPTFAAGENQKTYNVMMTVKDVNGGVLTQTQQTVTVLNPATAYTASNTYCFSNNTDFTGCPASVSNSNKITSSNFTDITSKISSNRRLLVKNGSSWNYSGSYNSVGGFTNATIDTFGTGNKPVITSGTNAYPLVLGSGTQDLRVIGLNFNTALDAVQFSGDSNSPVKNILFKDITINNTQYSGFEMIGSSQNVVFQNIMIDGAQSYGFGVWNDQKDIALLDSTLKNIGGGQHMWRSCAGKRVLIDNSTFADSIHSGNSGPTVISIRTGTDAMLVSRSSFGNGANEYSVNISGCSPDNNSSVPNLMFDRNTIKGYTSNKHGDHVTFRNNIFLGNGFAGGGIGNDNNTTSDIKVFNNVYIGTNTFVSADSGSAPVEIRNNIYGGNNVFSGSANASQSNNVKIGTPGLNLITTPGPNYLHLPEGSIGVNVSGILTKVLRAANLNNSGNFMPRPQGSNSDIGPFEI